MGRSVHREPSDQTDLRNDIDAILEDGEGTLRKRADSGAHKGPGGTMVGPAGPIWQPLGVCLRGLPPGVIWSLLELFRGGFA
jgi:hypothetical protein